MNKTKLFGKEIPFSLHHQLYIGWGWDFETWVVLSLHFLGKTLCEYIEIFEIELFGFHFFIRVLKD